MTPLVVARSRGGALSPSSGVIGNEVRTLGIPGQVPEVSGRTPTDDPAAGLVGLEPEGEGAGPRTGNPRITGKGEGVIRTIERDSLSHDAG